MHKPSPKPNHAEHREDPAAAAFSPVRDQGGADGRPDGLSASAWRLESPMTAADRAVLVRSEDAEEEIPLNPEFTRRFRPRITYTIRGSHDAGWQIDVFCRIQLPFERWPDRKEIQKALLEALDLQDVRSESVSRTPQ